MKLLKTILITAAILFGLALFIIGCLQIIIFVVINLGLDKITTS